MLYEEWFEQYALKHKEIVDKLLEKGYDKEQIIDYFDYDNMVKEEIEFCPLYKIGKKCHNMKELNCYLCGCPNFRFNDNGIDIYNGYKVLSKCDINNGSSIGRGGAVHQDCSKCSVPHHRAYVKKHFDTDWKKIMKEVKVDE